MDDYATPYSRLRTMVHAIPPVLRPLALLVAPLVLFHLFFIRTPDGTTAPPAPAVTTATQPKPAAPSEDEIRSLIEHADDFLLPKRATCPAVGSDSDLGRNVLFRALRDAQYLTVTPVAGGQIRIGITPEGHYALGADLTDDVHEITLAVARKVFTGVRKIDPPPQALSPPLKYATRVEFSWKWSPTNKIGNFIEFVPYSTLAGVAYFQRQPNRTWTLAQVDFHDITPDLQRNY